MKTVKSKIITISIIIASMIFIGSCNKRNNSGPQLPDDQSQANLGGITISDNFEWKTARNVTIKITSATPQVITISSTDQEIRYHRGMLTETGEYNITLSIPYTINAVSINGQTVGISSKNITCNLNDLKAATATIIDSDGDGIADNLDDFPTIPTQSFNNFTPATGTGSLGFEDLWPGKGDYDFNDIVVDYNFATITNPGNKVVQITATFILKASGAFLRNGFGFNLPNANSSLNTHLTVTGYDLRNGYITLNPNGLEAGQSKPTIIVFDDALNMLPHPGVGIGINTENWAPFVPYDTVTIIMTPNSLNYTLNDFSLGTWNPFIIINGERGKEVHLPNYPPTNLVNPIYFGTWDDDTRPGFGKYYKTNTNLPWAINIVETFEWPREKIEIGWAYFHFIEWAQSSGATYPDWYKNYYGYRNNGNIYHPSIP